MAMSSIMDPLLDSNVHWIPSRVTGGRSFDMLKLSVMLWPTTRTYLPSGTVTVAMAVDEKSTMYDKML